MAVNKKEAKSNLDKAITDDDLAQIKSLALNQYLDYSPNWRSHSAPDFRFETIARSTFGWLYSIGLIDQHNLELKIHGKDRTLFGYKKPGGWSSEGGGNDAGGML